VSSDPRTLDEIAREGAAAALSMFAELHFAASPRETAERRRQLLDAACARWPTLTATMAELERAAPTCASDGADDDALMQDVLDFIRARSQQPQADEEPVAAAATWANQVMDALSKARRAEASAAKRAWLVSAFTAWPKLCRRMGRIVQALAQAADEDAA
jgi:hypothetical protein